MRSDLPSDHAVIATDEGNYELDPVLGALILALMAAQRAGDMALKTKLLQRLEQHYGIKLMFGEELEKRSPKAVIYA